jgi:hypothetical protein
MDSEARYNCMKCAVGIRQILGVPFGHDDFRMGAAGNNNLSAAKSRPWAVAPRAHAAAAR